MSLINDALTELELRNPDAQNTSKYDQGNTLKGASYIKYLLVIVSVVCFVMGYMQFSTISSSEIQENLTNNNLFIKDTTPSTKENSVLKAEVYHATETDEEPRTEKINQAIQITSRKETKPTQEIDKNILLGHYALSKNRLTLPEADNALYYFNKVLAVDSYNRDAIDGIESIKKQYKYLVEQAILQKNYTRAKSLITRANSALISKDQIDIWSNSIEHKERVTSIEEKNANPIFESIISQQKRDTSSMLTPSLSAREDVFLAELKSLQKYKNPFTREAALNEFLEGNPKSIRILITLLEHYLALDRMDRANELVKNHQGQAYSYFIRAKTLHKQGLKAEAIELLEKNKRQEILQEESHAMLAALYHELHQFSKAIEIYEILTRIHRSKSRYWLGLGLSSDAMAKYKQARQAYLRVLRLDQVHPDISEYVKKRIKTLNKKETHQVVETSRW